MTTGLVVLLAAVVLALGFGLWRAATDGRFRGTHRVRGGAEQHHRLTLDVPEGGVVAPSTGSGSGRSWTTCSATP